MIILLYSRLQEKETGNLRQIVQALAGKAA